MKMSRLFPLAIAALSTACSSAPKTETQVRQDQPAAQAAPAPESRLQVGDTVTYRFSGSFRKTPVVLKETVIAKDGLRVKLQMDWQSGKEKRSWRHTSLDTLQARHDNLIEELFEITGGQEKKLANVENKDFFRLYAGTYPEAITKVNHETVETRTVTACGQKVQTQVTIGEGEQNKRKTRYELAESDEFPWLMVSGLYKQGTSTYYKAELVSCGGPSFPAPASQKRP